MSLRDRVKSLTLMGLVLFVATACNFHTVQKKVLYRSSQLDGKQFQAAIDRYKIKSIINLRGAKPGQKWWEDEKAVAEENNVVHVDIGMSAKRLPHRHDLMELIDSFETLPRPMLIHCQGGADRTGEASAMFAMDYLGYEDPMEASRDYLNAFYLHLRPFMPAKSYFIEEIYRGKQWARDNYYPCESNYKYYDKNLYCQTQEEL